MQIAKTVGNDAFLIHNYNQKIFVSISKNIYQPLKILYFFGNLKGSTF